MYHLKERKREFYLVGMLFFFRFFRYSQAIIETGIIKTISNSNAMGVCPVAKDPNMARTQSKPVNNTKPFVKSPKSPMEFSLISSVA